MTGTGRRSPSGRVPAPGDRKATGLPDRLVDRRAPVPLYYRIASALEARIRSGNLPPGARVPGEKDLAVEHGVSPITVRAAMRVLLDQNLIVRQPGRGTFVTEWGGEKRTWGLDSMEALLSIASNSQMRLVGWHQVPTPPWVGEFAPAVFNARCLRVQLLRRSDDVPYLLTNAYYPPEIAAMLRSSDFARAEARHRLAIHIVEDKCHLTVSEVRQTMSAEVADVETAKCLGLKRGAPILTVVRENYTDRGELLQLAKSYYRTDRYRFVVNLSHVDASNRRRSWT